ncbi:hypothetical protein AB1N83_013881 [Pleurotus pulmonarius]
MSPSNSLTWEVSIANRSKSDPSGGTTNTHGGIGDVNDSHGTTIQVPQTVLVNLAHVPTSHSTTNYDAGFGWVHGSRR